MAEADRLRLAARVQADYDNYGYAPLLAADLQAVASVGGDVAASAEATAGQQAAAGASAAQAASSAVTALAAKVAAETAVGSVTVGSTASLAYPEQVRSLITATDVVDVLVYDTRLDSDGGAWTERCTGTSWFQETLNTATRGAKRAFPKVALILAQATGISIYDALDLDANGVPRLWMTFFGTSTNFMLLANSGTPLTCVTARNGRLYRGVNLASLSVVMIDFIEDLAVRFSNAGSSSGAARDYISLRNATGSFNLRHAAGLVGATLGLDTTVLPGSPLNRLGLPAPTLLAANALGFTLLHHTDALNSRGASVTISGGYSRARFTPDNRIIALGITAPGIADVGPIPYAATTANTAWRTHRIGSSAITATGGIILPDAEFASTMLDLADGAVAQATRLALLAEDLADVTASMVASIGPAYNSGWMPGTAIQLAALCDGVAGTATQSGELVANGDFATGDLTGWINASTGVGTATVVGGAASLYRQDTSNWGRIYQAFTTVMGETYVVSFDQLAAANTAVLVGTTMGGAQNLSATTSGLAKRTYSFVATGTTTYVQLQPTSTGGTALVDNISIRLGSPDRSYRQNGLVVTGALARMAVGTGNDVTAFSGFSASNYLTQPSNTALAVATGDVMIAAWVNLSSYAAAFPIVLAQGADALQLGVTAATGFNFRLQSSVAATDLTVTGTTQSTGQWVFVLGLRRAGTMEIWVNGVREATLAAAGTLTATPGALEVGRHANAAVMSIALLRVASYAPTPGQITRMFRDEQRLFQAGAKAFLGMAATATVKRLSRSRFTGRLAVAMSDGLALFDGLQRVERHTSGTLSPAMASSDVPAISMEAGCTLIGTAANIGNRREAVVGLDRLPANPATPSTPRTFRARGVTTDATPLILAPRLPIAERETLMVSVQLVGRVYGANDTQRLTYERRATYFRDAGGSVTLAGSVQVVGTDVEVTSTADATLVIDTTAQTIAAQVTGIAATRLAWTARFQIERSTHETSYEEVV